MERISIRDKSNIPGGLIVFISGVPGVGKTTISYELLRRYNEFRIIQETDLIREILRGYNEYLEDTIDDVLVIDKLHTKAYIPDHMKIFNYEELKIQCSIMKKSIEKIIMRQQRKGIPSIINGVHIIPEILNGIAQNKNVVYINLYISTKEALQSRLSSRDAQKYMPYLDVSFAANCTLYESVLELTQEFPYVFQNIDVTNLTIDQVVDRTVNFIDLIRI